jgi:hypothetical protein
VRKNGQSVKCESAQVIHCTCHDGLAGLKHEPHEVSLQLTFILDSPHRDAALPFPMLAGMSFAFSEVTARISPLYMNRFYKR